MYIYNDVWHRPKCISTHVEDYIWHMYGLFIVIRM